MNQIFGELKQAEVIFIRDLGEEVEFPTYIWRRSAKHIALYIPVVGVATPCLHCEDTSSVDLITRAINDYLCGMYSALFPREQSIRFPQSCHSAVDDEGVPESGSTEDDAHEFK